MNQTMEEAIVRVREIYQQVTGETAPEPTPGSPYARIPPEVDAEEYVTMKAASLLEKVRSIGNGKVNGNDTADHSAVDTNTGRAMRAMPIPAAIIRGENELRWVLEMPGVPKTTIEVELLGTTLRVSGSRPAVNLDRGDQVLGSDLAMGRLERVLTLPMAVEANQVQANLADGILSVRVRLPVSSNRATKIEVR